jgi:hypothetical protein
MSISGLFRDRLHVSVAVPLVEGGRRHIDCHRRGSMATSTAIDEH